MTIIRGYSSEEIMLRSSRASKKTHENLTSDVNRKKFLDNTVTTTRHIYGIKKTYETTYAVRFDKNDIITLGIGISLAIVKGILIYYALSYDRKTS